MSDIIEVHDQQLNSICTVHTHVQIFNGHNQERKLKVLTKL